MQMMFSAMIVKNGNQQVIKNSVVMSKEIMINGKAYKEEIEIEGKMYFLIYEPYMEDCEVDQRFTHAYVLKSEINE